MFPENDRFQFVLNIQTESFVRSEKSIDKKKIFFLKNFFISVRLINVMVI